MLDYFKNKEVAIIGNAKSLLTADYGKVIDEHEVVIRLNRSFMMIPPKTRHYLNTHGSKMDVLMVNLFRTVHQLFSSREFPKVKIVQVTSCGVPDTLASRLDYIIPESISNPFKENFSKKPSVGIRAINFVLLGEPKVLHIYGFDFKNTPSYYGFGDVYKTEEHDFLEEREFFLNHFESKVEFHQ